MAGHIGAVALKAIPDCNFRCQKDPGTDMGYDCYEYVDDRWESLPDRMPDEVLTKTGTRIGEYTKEAGLSHMQIIFHGGEPLFTHDAAGYYDHAIMLLKESILGINEDVTLSFGMHTNASLITRPTLEMMKRNNVMTSCSIDGNEEAHNRNRKTKKRELGTFKMVDRGIRRLSESCGEICAADCADHFDDQFSGLLAVIDLRNDPIETYEQLCSYNPKRVDFMLPYANHDSPPAPAPEGASPTPYADWLLTIHRRWIADQEAGKKVPDVRQFSSIANLARGLPSGTEALGPLTSSVVFVRSDGSFEGLDALNAASRETLETDMNVFNDSLEDVATRLRQMGQLGRKSVAAACSDCKLLEICGGGHLESRYSKERGFDRESVFCEDLKVLIKEVVATTNAKYSQEIAGVKLREIVRSSRDQTVPAAILPSYEPPTTPSERKLALRIRPIEDGDVAQVTELHAEAFFANYKDIISPSVLDAYIANDFLPRKYEYWRDQVESLRQAPDDERLLVATLGSRLLGFTALKIMLYSSNVAFLNAHYVSPQADGYGVSRQLLAEVEHSLKKTRVIRAQAVADQSPQTTHLLEGGFQPAHFLTQTPQIYDQTLALQPMERQPWRGTITQSKRYV